MKTLRPLFLCTLGIVAAGASHANAAPPTPAQWTVDHLPKKPVGPSATFTVVLTAAIEPGWHIYALEEPEGGPIATEIGLQQGDPLTLLAVNEPEPRKLPDPVTRVSAGMFQTSVGFTLKLRAPQANVAPDASTHILVRYQSCNDHVCLPPHTETIALPLHGVVR